MVSLTPEKTRIVRDDPPENLSEKAAKIAAAMPALTADQRDRLIVLLRGGA